MASSTLPAGAAATAAATTAPTRPAATPTTAPTAPTAPAPPTSPAPAARPAGEAAQAATLTAADLPGNGWQPESSPEFFRADVTRSSRPECEMPNVLRSGQKPASRAESGFFLDGATGTESVRGAALVYPSPATAAASASVAHILKLARSCQTWKNGGLDGESYGFVFRQTVEKAASNPATSLLYITAGAEGMPDVPPSIGGTAVHREGRVVTLIHAFFPPSTDRGAVGYREMADLAKKLSTRGA